MCDVAHTWTYHCNVFPLFDLRGPAISSQPHLIPKGNLELLQQYIIQVKVLYPRGCPVYCRYCWLAHTGTWVSGILPVELAGTCRHCRETTSTVAQLVVCPTKTPALPTHMPIQLWGRTRFLLNHRKPRRARLSNSHFAFMFTSSHRQPRRDPLTHRASYA